MTFLISHPKIYLGPDGAQTNALLIDNGQVRATGEKAKQSAESKTPVVEPEADSLFPGLADAHCHLWGLGQRPGTIEFGPDTTPEDIYTSLKRGDGQLLSTDWMIGQGWEGRYWPDRVSLSREKLDELCPNRPVCLHRSDRHAIFVNTEALRRADLDDNYRPRGDGRAERDDNGNLTGLLVDEAMNPVLDAIPPPDEREDRRQMRQTAEHLLDFGITSAHMAKVMPERLELLQKLRDRKDDLPIRIYAMIHGPTLFKSDIQLQPFHDPDAWCSWNTLKYFADGALRSQGALVLEPYKDGLTGLEVISRDEFEKQARHFARDGWQFAVHAIGDRAARNIIDVFASLPEDQQRATRPRLEHAQMVASADIERMSNMPIVSSIQPTHLISDCSWAHKIMEPFQLNRLYPFDELQKHSTLAGGSDYPIDDANPWHAISAAQTRKTRTGEAFYPEKGLDRTSMLEAYTTGAAWAAHWEQTLGQLKPGFKADIIGLDRDPFDTSAESIWETETLQVWLEGKRVR